MGEVVLSSEMAAAAENNRQQNVTSDAGESLPAVAGSSSLVRWERFLPKLAVRVLLVEADDSTRQIIAALLRKCSYKVAAVCDGLKAWEVLKSRAENVDLILTEVELPSISGYALLTLIMEHDICKNIPVISALDMHLVWLFEYFFQYVLIIEDFVDTAVMSSYDSDRE